MYYRMGTLFVFVLVATATLHGVLVASPNKGQASGTWLVLELFDPGQSTVSQWQDARSKVEKLPGHVESHAFHDVTNPSRGVSVSLWQSIEALEDRALALDGVDQAKPSSGTYFRQLRSSTFDPTTPMGHLELVVHRTRKGTTRSKNLALFDSAKEGFAAGEGLLGHSLWISADGQWLHLLRWRSAEDFEKTGKALMRTKGVGSWIRSLDFKRFEMMRGDVKSASD